ncbi:MAG: hypothetical protein CMJ76_08110 [Planctomycetaceae bacterium]|nr:hypothetical protein [Planctomycetaceae bacterium]
MLFRANTPAKKQSAFIFKFICCPLFLFLAITFRGCSMSGMQSVLEVQRTPLAYSAGLIDGLTMVQGKIRNEDATLSTIINGQPCVYFDWTKEKEETDSEGDKSWRTVASRRLAVDFRLVDSSSEVSVANRGGRPNRLVKKTGSRRYGNYRETEYAILLTDSLTVVGSYRSNLNQISSTDAALATEFTISTRGEDAILRSLGWSSMFWMVGAIFLFVFFVGMLFDLLRQHHIMMASLALFVTLPPVLFLQWLLLTNSQLDAAVKRVQQYKDVVGSLPADEQDQSLRLALLKRDTNVAVDLYETYRTRFTNGLHRFPGGYGPLEKLVLASDEQSVLTGLPERARTGSVLQIHYVVLLAVGGIAGTLFCGVMGYRKLKTKRMIENIPTSPVKGVVPGITEVVGSVLKKDKLLSGRYSGTPVIYCRYLKERRVKTDKDKYEWRTVESGVSSTEFFLKDETGQIVVDPEKADVDASRTYYERTGNLRYTEWTLKPGQELYILGPAVLDSLQDTALTIEHSSRERHFVISDQDESSVLLKYARTGLTYLGLGIALCTSAVFILYGGASFDPFGYFAGALFAALFLLVLNIAFIFNDLVFMKAWLSRARANLNVSLKRRADLIPNLVKIVKTALSFEKDVQTRIAQLRYGITGDATTTDRVGGLLDRFKLLLEDYPSIKTDKLVVNLGNRIVEVENQLQFARSGLNAVTGTHNIRIRTFPDVLLARLMGMQPASFFQLEQQREGQAVDVNALLDQKTETQQLQNVDKKGFPATMNTTELFVAAVFCVLCEDRKVEKEEYARFYKFAASVTALSEPDQLKALGKKIENWISEVGLKQAVIETSKRLESVSGNEEAGELINVMNSIAEADGEVTSAEEAIIAQFRDALGGSLVGETDASDLATQQGLPAEKQQEILMLTLISLVSADGQINADEYRAIVEFTIASTPLTDREQVRQSADSALGRIKESGLEKIGQEVTESLPNAFSKDVVDELVQFIAQLSEVDGEVHENEQKLAQRYLKALRQD